MTHATWFKLSLVERMANIGSEVERALKWREKNYDEYSRLTNNRALKLFDLTMAARRSYGEFKEIARTRELWLDFYAGNNQYKQTAEQ